MKFNNLQEIMILCSLIRSQLNETHVNKVSTYNNTSNKNNNETILNDMMDNSSSLVPLNFQDLNYSIVGQLFNSNLDLISNINDYICNDYESYLSMADRKNIKNFKFYAIKYIYPVIFIFGIFGNILSILTMLRIYRKRKHFRNFTINLAILAVTDIFVLVFGCVREWFEDLLQISIKTFNNNTCKFVLLICYISSSFSAWIHVFITLERWIAINKPFRIKIICTTFLNRVWMLSLLLLCVLMSSPLIWFSKISEHLAFNFDGNFIMTEVKVCEVQYDIFMGEAMIVFIDSVFFCILPFIIILVFSSLTIIELIRSDSESMKKTSSSSASNSSHMDSREAIRLTRLPVKRKENIVKKERYVLYSVVSSDKNNNTAIEIIAKASSTLEPRGSNTGLKKFDYRRRQLLDNNNNVLNDHQSVRSTSTLGSLKRSKMSRKSSNLKITLMLLSLPICYLVTILPIVVLITIGWFMKQYHDTQKNDTNQTGFKHFDVAYSIASILMYLNSSVNILIYILFGKNLRQDFIAMLKCGKGRESSVFSFSRHQNTSIRRKTIRKNI